jgi:hypothetical protein
MSTVIDLVVFGTFGTPNGFTQSSLLKNTYRTFDLNTNAIGLFSKTKMYSIRKEVLDGDNIISYSIYTFAKEKFSERGGTFIGSNISFFNKIANENLIVNSLNAFHQDLISNELNVSNEIIQVVHSNKLKANKPKDFDKIDFHLRQIEELDFSQTSNKSLVVYSEVNSNKLQKLFKQSIDLLNTYDIIYFTSSNEIAEFVHQKGLFKLVKRDGFEQEIKSQEIDRKRRIELSIAELEKEKENLEIDRARLLAEYHQQIENNEKLHKENRQRIDESKKQVTAIDEKYQDFKKKIDDSIIQLRAGKKLNVVKELLTDNKRIFIDSINLKKSLSFINNIPQPSAQTDLRASSKQNVYEYNTFNRKYHEPHPREDKVDVFKIVALLLLILWVGTIIYFLIFNSNENLFLYLKDK